MDRVLDARVYRAAFLPAFILLFVVAFSLENRPPPAHTNLPAEGFDAARAFGSGSRPARDSLLELARAIPQRAPGSAGDASLADRVAGELALGGRFEVTRSWAPAETGRGRVRLETVVGVRPGLSNRRLVVLAHRDAMTAPGTAELSGTAVLMELARIAERRELRKTLVLVSTSGGSIGAAGARAWAATAGDPRLIDGVLVLGDMASRATRRPWVVPWSDDDRPAPHALRRTVERAARVEVDADPGGARAITQWVRRAVPLTYSEQGPLVAANLPAVLLQASGERGPGPQSAVSADRFDAFGRSALRTITALDQTPSPGERRGAADVASPYATDTDGIVTLRKVLPTWALRLLLLALLLPAVLAVLDTWTRVRRGGTTPWRRLAWASAGAIPLLAAWAFARLLDLSGLLDAPRGVAAPGAVPIEGGGLAAMALTVVAAAAGWLALRRPIERATGVAGRPTESAGAAAVGVLVAGLCLVLLIANPYAGALMLPAVHLWPLAMSGARRRWVRVVAIAGGAALPAMALAVYGMTLGMAPLDLAWMCFLAAVGGAVELGSAVAVCLFGAALIATVAVALARPRASDPSPSTVSTRGPASYAGPGSLGGTTSALRR